MAEKAYEDMTPDERLAWRIDAWRKADVEFASAEAEADYKARVDRVVAALQSRKPDRVPVRLNTGFWPAKTAGLTPYEAMSDAKRGAAAWRSGVA